MKPASAKAKGRILQQYVVKKLLEAYPNFTTRDIRSTSMGCSGVDIQLSQRAFDQIPLSIECKNQEITKPVLKMWSQTQANAGEGHPVLVLHANRSPTVVVVELSALIDLVRKAYGE